MPALVSEELFEAVAEQLAENKRRNRQSGRGAKYLLQGLLQCKCCGYAYYGSPNTRRAADGTKRRYIYYRCTGNDSHRVGGQHVCGNKQLRAEVLEAAVWDDACSLLQNPDRIRKEYERRLNSGNESFVGLKRTQAMIAKVQRAISRFIDAYEEGLLSKEEFEPRIRTSKERLSRLESERTQLASQESEQRELRLLVKHFDDFSQQISVGLDKLDWTTKREVLRAFVKRVEIDRDNVRVIYKVSPLPFVRGPASGANLQDCLWRLMAALTRFVVLRFPHRTIGCRLASPSVFSNLRNIAAESIGNRPANPVYLFDRGFTRFPYHRQATPRGCR